VLLSAQHALFDGFSRTVFWDELSALYQRLELPALPFQYTDYARSQREYLSSVDEERLAAWKDELSAQSPELPTDDTGAVGRGVVKTILDADLLEELRRRARAEQSSIFVLLFAAWVRLLRQRSRMSEFVVGTFYANRHHDGVDKLIGCFNQQVAMRFRDVTDDCRVLFEEVKRTVLRTYANLDVNPYVAPPVRVGINFNPKITIRLPNATIARLDRLRESDQQPWFHLSLRLEEEERAVFAAFLYDRRRFRESTIFDLAQRYDELLRDLVAHLK
jgi:condensation domain-containing protein